jgi:hypothetical protein
MKRPQRYAEKMQIQYRASCAVNVRYLRQKGWKDARGRGTDAAVKNQLFSHFSARRKSAE